MVILLTVIMCAVWFGAGWNAHAWYDMNDEVSSDYEKWAEDSAKKRAEHE